MLVFSKNWELWNFPTLNLGGFEKKRRTYVIVRYIPIVNRKYYCNVDDRRASKSPLPHSKSGLHARIQTWKFCHQIFFSNLVRHVASWTGSVSFLSSIHRKINIERNRPLHLRLLFNSAYVNKMYNNIVWQQDKAQERGKTRERMELIGSGVL